MISVCLATYNGEKYIKEQIESILVQLNDNDELIVSDDNSSDKTVNIITGFLDSRIRLFINIEKGYTSNFENALKQAKGDIIFLSDQDDIWSHNKVAICSEYLKSCDLVVSDCIIIDENKNIIAESYYEERKPKKSCLGNLIKFGYLGACLAFRAEILEKALPFPHKRLLCTHDNWLFLVGACYFNHKILYDKLILYRRHKNNFSSGGLSNSTTTCFKIRYRIYLVFNILLRYLIK